MNKKVRTTNGYNCLPRTLDKAKVGDLIVLTIGPRG